MIGFLQPWVLLGLPLAAIPLLLHLVQRREPPSVVFPAVRYLRQVSEEHQRRLRIRHLLLLLIRTALILLLVLAAANPTMRGASADAHPPTALVIVLDNSVSSGAVAGGSVLLAGLKRAARSVLDRATTADALWLVTADGVPRRGLPAELGAVVDSVTPDPRRIDLGQTIGQAQSVLGGEGRDGAIVVVSDLQASAVTAAAPGLPLVVARPADPPPANGGIGAIESGPQPWASAGGTLVIHLSGDSASPTPLTVALGSRPARSALATGGFATISLSGLTPGWWTATAAKAPDEFRADDEASVVLRVVSPARATCAGAGLHLTAACQVLTESGRIRPGDDVSLAGFGPVASIVMPPEDPSGIGALNRALERRGSTWRFGRLSAVPAFTDSGAMSGRVAVTRRLDLVPAQPGAADGVVATAGGQPWVVRSGSLVLLGSRLEPDWTELPLTAAFPGFVDALVNRVARGDAVALAAAPGEPVRLPPQASALVGAGQRRAVEGGSVFRPRDPGVFFVLADGDTIGSITVAIDPRESRLERAPDDLVESLWPGARVVDLADIGDYAFAATGAASIQGPLLWVVLLLAGAELAMAAGRRRAP